MWKPLTYALILCSPLAQAQDPSQELKKFATHAKQHSTEATRASDYLLAGMPKSDRSTISSKLLINNITYALRAREEFPWCQKLSEEQFFNDVLPYAVLDETREDWRPKFYEISKALIKDCKTAGEAAQILNRDLFNKINVHYNRQRKKPNQSPAESMEINKATCTGLSIILTYACRSVGIPARITGTALWSDKSGNHTWVEIWDGEWKYLGADEYDAKGLNRGWFGGRASKATADNPLHAIWSTTWAPTKTHFPMVWDTKNQEINAVNVTARYTKNTPKAAKHPTASIRVFSKKTRSRIIASIALMDDKGNTLKSIKSLAGRADLNDITPLPLIGKAPWRIVIRSSGKQEEVTLKTAPQKTIDVILTEERKPYHYTDIVEAWKKEELAERQEELDKKTIKAGKHTMRIFEKKYGAKPKDGHSLWISMHGGGGAPAAVNDQQWQNQTKLYRPTEGYYVAPRAPTDTWNLWHREGVDALMDRLISNYVICHGVNPDRIYIMGYSAGGDGVYQLAPRMADRFAAASMMAGHPNDARPDNLRNLYYEIFMGGLDAAFDRNKIAAKWKTLLVDLQKADPEGYPHRVTIYPKLGHWMDRRDAEALPRMIKQTRNAWPKKVIWHQSNSVTHQRLYWLGVTAKGAIKKRQITGEVKGQHIALTGDNLTGIKLWLSDKLIDLTKEIIVTRNGEEAFRGYVYPSKEAVKKSLAMRCGMVATALLEIE